MSNMINFDNAATTFPKPRAVRSAVDAAIVRYGGNPGRSGHALSLRAAEKIYEVRALAAEMFGAEAENVAFTANSTFALNMAIKGIMQYGGHIIISSMEHNSVARPVYALSTSRGVTFSVARVHDDDEQTLHEIESLIKPATKCVCCMAASNVTGKILPYKQIAELCRRCGLCFICDCSQGAGVLDISLRDGMNFICTSGHKSLYGPTGTGLLISDGEYPLSTIIEGGTGATSSSIEQTPFLPEKLESGTLNTVGIIGLGEGLRFVSSRGIDNIRNHENGLCERLIRRLSARPDIRIYRGEGDHAPIVSFNIGEMSSHTVAAALSDRGFALRGGLHCAPLAHNTIGTIDQGTVRFSPSVFNNISQTERLCDVILSLK